MNKFKDIIKQYYNISDEQLNSYFDKETELDKHWYDTGEKDYSYYEKIEYVAIAYKSFERYSKNLVLSCRKYFADNHTILDYGAGIGLTTYLLSELFPNSKIYYENLRGEQYKFAEFLLKDRQNVFFTEEIVKSDIIICSEFFEHIRTPIGLLKDFFKSNPKYFVVSNSFRSKAYGHHSSFLVDNKEVDCKKMGRVFGKAMKDNGYQKEKIFWNGRPTIWGKII